MRQDKEQWHVDGPLRSEKRGVMEESSDDCFSDSRYNDTMRPESWEHCEHFRELHTISK